MSDKKLIQSLGGQDMATITEEILIELYSKRGLTDKKIADIYNVDRTSVAHLRKKYNIPSNINIELSIEKVIYKLAEFGFDIDNQNEIDKTSHFDLLLDQSIKIEVMSAGAIFDNTFRFPLTSKKENGHVESSNRIKLSNNRSRKLYRNTCDYIVCYGFYNNCDLYWIIPSNDINDTLQTISLPIDSSNSKYNRYKNAWDLIKK